MSLKNERGIMSYNLVPFMGSSFIPVLLNVLLFLPHGFLLPLVFTACKWNWKRILCIGAATSLIIEVLVSVGRALKIRIWEDSYEN